MDGIFIKDTAANIRRNVKYIKRMLPLTEDNSSFIDILQNIDDLAGQIQRQVDYDKQNTVP